MVKVAKATGVGGAITKYPYTQRDFRNDYPNASVRPLTEFPEARLNEEGFYFVDEVDRPAPSDPIMKNVVEQSPTWGTGNRLVQTWAEENATAEQIAERQRDAQDHDELLEAKANPTINYLMTHTPTQVYNKVQTDIVDLASAKDIIGRLAVAVSVGLRGKLR